MDDTEEPNFTIDDSGDRARVVQYIRTSKFRTGDKVYFQPPGGTREGPYIIASVPSAGKYTLCLSNGQSVKNGEEVDEHCLLAG